MWSPIKKVSCWLYFLFSKLNLLCSFPCLHGNETSLRWSPHSRWAGWCCFISSGFAGWLRHQGAELLTVEGRWFQVLCALASHTPCTCQRWAPKVELCRSDACVALGSEQSTADCSKLLVLIICWVSGGRYLFLLEEIKTLLSLQRQALWVQIFNFVFEFSNFIGKCVYPKLKTLYDQYILQELKSKPECPWYFVHARGVDVVTVCRFVPVITIVLCCWHTHIFLSLYPLSKEILEKQMHLDIILCCNGGCYLSCALGYANFILILQWACINIISVVVHIVLGDNLFKEVVTLTSHLLTFQRKEVLLSVTLMKSQKSFPGLQL